MKLSAKDGLALYRLGCVVTDATTEGGLAVSDKNRQHLEALCHKVLQELNASADVITATVMVHTRNGGDDLIHGCVIGKAPLVTAMMIALNSVVDEGTEEASIQKAPEEHEVAVITPENVH